MEYGVKENKHMSYRNRHAKIRVRQDRTGKFRTETAGRDGFSSKFAMTTDPNTNTTSLFLDLSGCDPICMTGTEARTLYQLLHKHYVFTGKVTI
jgi:hypothetical protein